MAVHPRVSLNAICSMKQSFEDDLALWQELGVDHVGLITPKFDGPGWDTVPQALGEAGLQVSSVSCYRDAIAESIDITAAIGTNVLYIPPGRFSGDTWDEVADRFCDEVGPLAARAREQGITLAVEPTNPLRTDVSFLHTVRDAVDLARRAGVGVVVDYYSAWYERGLEALLRDNIDVIALVQVSDYKLGTFDMPNRCAIGDGDIPVERLTRLVLDAGYEGAFDLEILGPQIEAEGYRPTISRSLEHTSELLTRLGA